LGIIRVSVDLGIGKLEVEGSTIEEVLAHLEFLPDALPDISAKINKVCQAVPEAPIKKMRGVKLTNVILRLKRQRWFEKPQDVDEIVKKLKKMGVPANRKMVAPALVWLTKKGELEKKEKENKTVYFAPPSIVKL
jgi:hypothetical protein